MLKNWDLKQNGKEYLLKIFDTVFNGVIFFTIISFIFYIYIYFKYVDVKNMSKKKLNIQTLGDFFNCLMYITIFLSYTIHLNSFMFIYVLCFTVTVSIIINSKNFLEVIQRTKPLDFWE